MDFSLDGLQRSLTEFFKGRPTIGPEEWFELVCRSYEQPPVFYGKTRLPAFPPDTLHINTTGQAGANTLREAFIFYEDCSAVFAALGKPISPRARLLDFGVGWGRIARFFLRELPLDRIHGIDVTPEFIEVCKQTFGSDRFTLTTPFPPTTLGAGMFDYVVGYSVFSHLSEEACLAWMREFHRITRPGAMIALTTRGRPFFDYCAALKAAHHDEQDDYLGALARMFDDIDAARARYDQGRLVHSNAHGVTGGGAMSADFYGETFIPEQYARTAYAEWFTLEKFLYDPARQTHPIMFFRRK